MEQQIFYGEDRIVQLMLEGDKGWLFYVSHNTKELFDEYIEYCVDNHLDPTEETSAHAFMQYREENFEESFLTEIDDNI